MTENASIRQVVEKVFGPHHAGKIVHGGKWALYFLAIGIIAGLGAIVFHYLCLLGSHYFMDMIAGYRPPSPAGEHHILPPTSTPFNRWILLFLPAFGGLVSGWIVYTLRRKPRGTEPMPPSALITTKGGSFAAASPLSRPSPRPSP